MVLGEKNTEVQLQKNKRASGKATTLYVLYCYHSLRQAKENVCVGEGRVVTLGPDASATDWYRCSPLGPSTSFALRPLTAAEAGMETGGLIAGSLSALPGSTGQEIPQIPGL